MAPDLVRVLGAASAWGFAFSSFYLLPKFLTQELGAGPAQIGSVVGLLGISTVACAPLAGRMLDRVPRHAALAAGALLMAASALGFLWVDRIGVAIAVLRVVQGASYALVVTGVGVLAADCVPRERLSQALGLSGASMLVMNALAPAVAEPLAAAAGWRAVFAAAAAAATLSAVLAARLGAHAGAPAAAMASRGGLLAVLRKPVVASYAAVVTLTGAAFGAVFTFEPAYALALGRARVGGFFVAYAVAAIVVRVGFGRLPERFGLHRTAQAALALYAVVVLAIAGASASLLEPLGALFGLAHGVFLPTVNAMVVGAVPAPERGRVMAVFTGSFSLGSWAGATFLGHLAEATGYPVAFGCAALATFAGLGVLATSPALRAAGAPIPASDAITPRSRVGVTAPESRRPGPVPPPSSPWRATTPP